MPDLSLSPTSYCFTFAPALTGPDFHSFKALLGFGAFSRFFKEA
jgi:hypothetical protein